MELNETMYGVRVVQAAPITVNHVDSLVFGFEESGENRGDSLHLMFLFHPALKETKNFLEALSLFRESEDVLVRVHSECILGDAMNSTICDCRKQLQYSIGRITAKGEGIILYLRQEGRGIGLRAKLSALALQEGFVAGRKQGGRLSPDQANVALDLPVDARDYTPACSLLKGLGIRSLILISGNLEKVSALRRSGLSVSYTDIPRTGEGSQREVAELKEKLTRFYNYEGL